MNKNQNMIIVGIIVIVCGGAIFMLLASASVPMFSVKEAMDYSQPDSLIDRKIQIVGTVKDDFNISHFSIIDPGDKTNASLIIYVNANNVERPLGFDINATLTVEGKLLSIGENWLFKASRITKSCPSKYSDEPESLPIFCV